MQHLAVISQIRNRFDAWHIAQLLLNRNISQFAVKSNGIIYDKLFADRPLFHCFPCRLDAFRDRDVKDRDGFKADKASVCIDGGHGSGAGAGADGSHYFAGTGVGFNQILAQLHGFLCGMDGVLCRGKSQRVFGKAQVVLRSTVGTKKFPVVGTVVPFTGDFLIGFTFSDTFKVPISSA